MWLDCREDEGVRTVRKKKLCLRMDWWEPKEDLQESVCSCPMSEAKDLLSGKNLGQT